MTTKRIRTPGTRALAAFLALVLTAMPLQAQRTELEPGFNLYSPEDDVTVGRQFIEQSEPELELIEDEILAEYVNRLGLTLAQHAPGFEYPYRFRLVNDSAINAFALPGGPIYLNRGIIERATREAEVAGVLAHEIGHVALRHGTNQASKGQLVSAPLAILGGIFGGDGVAGLLTQVGVGFAANAVFLKYSRDAERQADLLGAQILYDAGYDPTGMPEFFEKLAAEAGDRGSEFFSSHPNPGNRAQSVSDEISKLGERRDNYIDNFSDFRRIQERLADVPAPDEDDAEAEAAEPARPTTSESGRPQLPSDRVQRYQDSIIRFEYPSNWTARSSNGSVTAAPAGGILNDGSMAYGLLVSEFEPQRDRRGNVTIEDATDQLLENLRESNPSMRVGQGYRSGRLDGRAALSVGLLLDSPLGGRERAWLVSTFGPDQTFYYLIGVAPQPEFDRYEPAYQRIFDSVDFR